MMNNEIEGIEKIITYKDGKGKGLPSKICFKYFKDSKYDDVINKFNNQNDYHLPSVEEAKILRYYYKRTIHRKHYMTSESLNDKHVTLIDFINMDETIFVQGKKEYSYPIILTYIEYVE